MKQGFPNWTKNPQRYKICTTNDTFQKNFLGFDNDYATTIYHAFVALCYFFPLIGGIIADSFWGKVKTILILSIVYLAGMVLMAVAAVPQLGGNDDPTQADFQISNDSTTHRLWAIAYLQPI